MLATIDARSLLASLESTLSTLLHPGHVGAQAADTHALSHAWLAMVVVAPVVAYVAYRRARGRATAPMA